MKRWLFGLSLLLLSANLFGYSYWKANPINALASSNSSEQVYYEQLVYVVNEIHNQVEQYHTSSQEGTTTLNQLDKGETLVVSLMSALTSSPEELIVPQLLTNDIYTYYQQYIQHLKVGKPLIESYELVNHSYEQFQLNAKIITILNSYKGVNTICH